MKKCLFGLYPAISICSAFADLKRRTLFFLLWVECVWASKFWILSAFLHTLNIKCTVMKTRKNAISFCVEVLAFKIASRSIWLRILLRNKSISLVYTRESWAGLIVFVRIQWLRICILFPHSFEQVAKECHFTSGTWLRLFWCRLRCFRFCTSYWCHKILQLQI